MFNLAGFNWGLDGMFGFYIGEIILEDNSNGYLLAFGVSPKEKTLKLAFLYSTLLPGGLKPL
jgi:hypothetical protein